MQWRPSSVESSSASRASEGRQAWQVGKWFQEAGGCRERVAEAAAARAQATAEWLQSHTFIPEEQLSKWTNVVRYPIKHRVTVARLQS